MSVDEVLEGSPASEAGLLVGDIVLEFEGQKLAGKEDLKDLLKEKASGDMVELLVKRGDEELEIEVKLGKK